MMQPRNSYLLHNYLILISLNLSTSKTRKHNHNNTFLLYLIIYPSIWAHSISICYYRITRTYNNPVIFFSTFKHFHHLSYLYKIPLIVSEHSKYYIPSSITNSPQYHQDKLSLSIWSVYSSINPFDLPHSHHNPYHASLSYTLNLNDNSIPLNSLLLDHFNPFLLALLMHRNYSHIHKLDSLSTANMPCYIQAP